MGADDDSTAEDLQTLGARLRHARTLAGLSARALDILAGMAIGHVSLIEAGRRVEISGETAHRLSRPLGISMSWLVSGDGPPPDRRTIARAVKHARARTGTEG